MHSQITAVGGIRMFQLKQAKVMINTDFFISRPGLYVIWFCAFRDVCLIIDIFFLHLRDRDYPAASHFPMLTAFFQEGEMLMTVM